MSWLLGYFNNNGGGSIFFAIFFYGNTMRFVALFRGINVGGHSMLKMSDLNAAFVEKGFENVVTYINSGNIAFDSLEEGSRKTSAEEILASDIEQLTLERFEKPVTVTVRTQPRIKEILEANPFEDLFESHKEMHVVFLKSEMPQMKIDLLLENQTKDEQFVVRGSEIYCLLRLGTADSLLGKGFIDRRLKLPSTARNWRTVQKLAEL